MFERNESVSPDNGSNGTSSRTLKGVYHALRYQFWLRIEKRMRIQVLHRGQFGMVCNQTAIMLLIGIYLTPRVFRVSITLQSVSIA